MKRGKRIGLMMLGFFSIALPGLALIGGGYDLTWNTVDSGGATSACRHLSPRKGSEVRQPPYHTPAAAPASTPVSKPANVHWNSQVR